MHACVASLVSLSLCVFVSAHFICVCACSAGPLHIRDLQVGNLLDEKLHRIPTKAWREKQLFSIKSHTLSMDTLLGWAEETLKKLDKAKSWKSVRTWAKSQVQ